MADAHLLRPHPVLEVGRDLGKPPLARALGLPFHAAVVVLDVALRRGPGSFLLLFPVQRLGLGRVS